MHHKLRPEDLKPIDWDNVDPTSCSEDLRRIERLTHEVRKLRGTLGALWKSLSVIQQAVHKCLVLRETMYATFHDQCLAWHQRVSYEDHPDLLRQQIVQLEQQKSALLEENADLRAAVSQIEILHP